MEEKKEVKYKIVLEHTRSHKGGDAWKHLCNYWDKLNALIIIIKKIIQGRSHNLISRHYVPEIILSWSYTKSCSKRDIGEARVEKLAIRKLPN